MFLARGNRTILEVLLQAYRAGDTTVRWISPTTEQFLTEQLELHGSDSLAKFVRRCNETVTFRDRSILWMMNTGVRLDGGFSTMVRSAWLRYITQALRRKDGVSLTVATVHAIKGMEFGHVMLYEYNLFGYIGLQEDSQESNLLYVGPGAR